MALSQVLEDRLKVTFKCGEVVVPLDFFVKPKKNMGSWKGNTFWGGRMSFFGPVHLSLITIDFPWNKHNQKHLKTLPGGKVGRLSDFFVVGDGFLVDVTYLRWWALSLLSFHAPKALHSDLHCISACRDDVWRILDGEYGMGNVGDVLIQTVFVLCIVWGLHYDYGIC